MGLFDSSLSSITQNAMGSASGAIGADPSAARLAVAGLIPGGSIGLKIGGAKVNLNLGGGAPDWRLRVSLADSANYFYHAQSPSDRGIMSPLFGSATQNGVIFPYTPQVQVTHTASYSQQKFTHSNYPGYYYENSEVAAISINGEFTVQNNIEGQYLLAAITFFRAATKMWFGKSLNKSNLGFPPPMVFLNGYGANYLPNVPCVITSFSHTMPSDVDYIEVPMVMPGGVGAEGIGGAIAQGVGGILNGGNAGNAIGGALSGGINSVLGSTMGPSGAGINGLIGSLSGGKFGAGAGGTQSTRLPTSSQLSVTLQPIYSRTAASNFNLDDYAAGRMVGTGNKGGFI
jgi:hypothetical protein